MVCACYQRFTLHSLLRFACPAFLASLALMWRAKCPISLTMFIDTVSV